MSFLVFKSFGQSTKEKYADQLFSKNEFYEAGPVYEELAEKSLEKGDANYLYLSRSAECAISNRDYLKAISQYQKISTDEVTPKDLKNYLNCLLIARRYEDAVVLINKYPEMKSFSKRASQTNSVALNDLLKDSMTFEVVQNNVNSDLGDFGIGVFKNQVWLASGRKPVGLMIEQYTWDNTNYLKTYTGTIVNDEISDLELVTSLVSKYHDGPVAISPDGKTMFVTRNIVDKATSSKNLKLVEFRLEGDGSWKEIGDFKYNVPGKNVGHAFFKGNDRLYFVSEQDGGFGGSDIYYTEKTSVGWKEPMNLGKGINSSEDEFFPSFDDQNNFYFSSNGLLSLGGFDIYKVSSGSNDPINMGYPLNSNSDDFAFFPISDGFGFLSSDRNDNIDRIYNVRITPIRGRVEIGVLDRLSKKLIQDASVSMVDDSGNNVPLEKDGDNWLADIVPGRKYQIVAEKENYRQPEELVFGTDDLKRNEIIKLQAELELEKTTVALKTIDKITKEIVPNVSGYLLDEKNNRISFISDSLGNAIVKIPTNSSYDLSASKKGYVDYNQTLKISEMAVVELDLEMTAIKKDVTFEIKNILYDFNKYNLRDESMIELDKLVEFLKVNDNITVELSSHTDSRGSDQSNQILSQNRAESCVDYLISKGIPKSRIIAKGYGEKKLINNCGNSTVCSEEEHQANRRTEIKILSIK